jgi:hypothetical protein
MRRVNNNSRFELEIEYERDLLSSDKLIKIFTYNERLYLSLNEYEI